jgi:hypothetical protein
MLGRDDVDEELQRGFGVSIKDLEPLLKGGGDAAEMKFMECCRYLWQADGAELTEPFIEALFSVAREVTLHPISSDVDDCLRCTRFRDINILSRMKPRAFGSQCAIRKATAIDGLRSALLAKVPREVYIIH